MKSNCGQLRRRFKNSLAPQPGERVPGERLRRTKKCCTFSRALQMTPPRSIWSQTVSGHVARRTSIWPGPSLPVSEVVKRISVIAYYPTSSERPSTTQLLKSVPGMCWSWSRSTCTRPRWSVIERPSTCISTAVRWTGCLPLHRAATRSLPRWRRSPSPGPRSTSFGTVGQRVPSHPAHRNLSTSFAGCGMSVTVADAYRLAGMQIFCRIDYQIATSGIAATAQSGSVYKDRRFSDHAPLEGGLRLLGLRRPFGWAPARPSAAPAIHWQGVRLASDCRLLPRRSPDDRRPPQAAGRRTHYRIRQPAGLTITRSRCVSSPHWKEVSPTVMKPCRW